MNFNSQSCDNDIKTFVLFTSLELRLRAHLVLAASYFVASTGHRHEKYNSVL